MAANITFRQYLPTDKMVCLGVFDANCPEFFAPKERLDYVNFLDGNPLSYELCIVAEHVVGAFGLMGSFLQQKSLNWILLSPDSHGMGIGSAIMERISNLASTSGVSLVTIAASHKSAPFFAKFGAVEIAVIDNGWGPGMHRVDMELHLD
jgi:GNAT superfamily N-acetyltransferase